MSIQHALGLVLPKRRARILTLEMLPAYYRHRIVVEAATKKPHLLPCWRWCGKTDGRGYPRIWCDSAKHRFEESSAEWNAHRAVLLLAGRVVGVGQHVHHLCHNTLCVNPQHLLIVSPEEHAHIHRQERQESA